MNARCLHRCLPAALFTVCILLSVSKISGVSLPAALVKSGPGGPPAKGQISGGNVPLFKLPPDTTIQEFETTADLSAYALVYNRMKVKAHMEGKPKKLQSNATVVHNGTVVGTYPDVIPFSLELSPAGTSVAFGVVQWKTWNLPVYWIVRDGDRFESTGHYTEDVEFKGLAVPWFSPDGGRVAYMISVKKKRRIMVDEECVFSSQHARIENPWSADGKQLALVSFKNGKERLVVDGDAAAAAAALRVVVAPDTYVADDEGEAAFFIDGKACLAAREVHLAAASLSGDRFALSVTDHDGALKVLHVAAPCKTLETWQGEDWREVSDLTLSPDGKRVFFAAHGDGGPDAALLPEPADPVCGKHVLFHSVTLASEPARTAWIVAIEGKHGLCLDGRLLGTRDRIEAPMAFSTDGKSLTFYAWKKGELFLEKAPLSN
jgi:hypothetical protein